MNGLTCGSKVLVFAETPDEEVGQGTDLLTLMSDMLLLVSGEFARPEMF